MDLSSLQESFERAAKRQKLSSSKSQELIDQVISEVELTLSTITTNDSPSTSVKTLVSLLRDKLQGLGILNNLEGLQKELDTNLSRHKKNLEKLLHPDLSNPFTKADFDSHIINQIIITHLYQKGLLSTADSLIKEDNRPETILLRAQFQELHQMLNAIKSKNLDPVLNWASYHRATLEKSGSDIELKIHKLRFADILQNQPRAEAIHYAKTHLSPFASHHMKEVQALMGSLIWVGKLSGSPYADLVDPANWDKLVDELMLRYCDMSGYPLKDLLSFVVEAGEQGIPTLLKLANVMSGRKLEYGEMKQLPVPLELSKEFQFHSIFVCPVSREEGSEENPGMLLPCGHVLCKQSIIRLSRGNTHNFKCPLCPRITAFGECKQLFF